MQRRPNSLPWPFPARRPPVAGLASFPPRLVSLHTSPALHSQYGRFDAWPVKQNFPASHPDEWKLAGAPPGLDGSYRDAEHPAQGFGVNKGLIPGRRRGRRQAVGSNRGVFVFRWFNVGLHLYQGVTWQPTAASGGVAARRGQVTGGRARTQPREFAAMRAQTPQPQFL